MNEAQRDVALLHYSLIRKAADDSPTRCFVQLGGHVAPVDKSYIHNFWLSLEHRSS
jgi:hypothetical protein